MSDGARGHVILDATIMVTPGGDVAIPLQLPAGRLSVTARLTDDDVDAPTIFLIRAAKNADPAASLEMRVSEAGETATVDLMGGVYACNLHVNSPATDNATLEEVARAAQFVALTITHATAS
jgi:hypothetical protein